MTDIRAICKVGIVGAKEYLLTQFRGLISNESCKHRESSQQGKEEVVEQNPPEGSAEASSLISVLW